MWDGGTGVAIFPAGDTPPFDRVPAVRGGDPGAAGDADASARRREPLLVVASPRGVLRPTLSRARRRGRGDRGQARCAAASRPARRPPRRARLPARERGLGPGDFAVRGGIVDVFGVDRARPWRAEWFGDDVEDLRAFDPATQESIAKLESAQVWPARELDLSRESVARALERCAGSTPPRCARTCANSGRATASCSRRASTRRGSTCSSRTSVASPRDAARSPRRSDRAARRWPRASDRRGGAPRGRDRGSARAGGGDEASCPTAHRRAWSTSTTLFAALDRYPCFELVREAPSSARGRGDLGWRGVDSYVGRFDAFVREAIHEREERGCVLVVSRQQHRVEELAAEHGADTVDATRFRGGVDTRCRRARSWSRLPT